MRGIAVPGRHGIPWRPFFKDTMRGCMRSVTWFTAAALCGMMFAFLLSGCDSGGSTKEKADEPAADAGIPFSSMSPLLTATPGTEGTVELWGGSRPYSIQSVSDSSKVSVSGILESGGRYFLTVRGKTLGTSTVVVRDAVGKSTIPVEIRVQVFAAVPATVALAPLESAEVRLRYGTRPYAVTRQPDYRVANAVLADTLLFISAQQTGSTSVAVCDGIGIGDSIGIQITIVKAFSLGGGRTIIAGGTLSDTISGGTSPYCLYSYDASRLSASLNGGVLTLTAASSASGSSTVVVADNSIPRRLLSIPVSIAAPLTVTPASVSLSSGTSTTVSIAGGTAPYSITAQPLNTIAAASISGGSLTINAIQAGTTSLKISDASAPAQTKVLSITVRSDTGFTTAGNLSFSYASSSGQSTPFEANGVFYNIRAGYSGVGAYIYPGTPAKLIILAYKDFSQISADLVSLTINDNGAIGTGTYPFGSTAAKNAAGFYKINANLNDTSRMGYMFSSGTLTVTSYSGTSISGTFSGNAYDILNASTTISILNGKFTVPVISGANGLLRGKNPD
jgi:hypothetical protein